MDSDDFKDFHIYLDLVNIKNDIKKYKLEQYESLYINSLTKAVKTLESLLKVKKSSYGYTFTDEEIKSIKIDDWNKTIVGSNAIGDLSSQDIDLIIFGRFDDQMSEATLASAGPRYTDTENERPIIGVVNINANIKYSQSNSEYALTTTILHEFTHILGFLYSYFESTYKNIFKKTDENGVVRYYINSPKVLEVAKKYFNCSSIDGVQLEESGGEGTAASHWEARILLGEYMNGYTYREEEVVSEFTLALLEDTGYYKANYYTGGLMRYGKGKGCDFVNKKCVNSGQINPLFENEFFDSIQSDTNVDASCSSGRLSRAYRYLGVYAGLPSYYQYFSNSQEGGFEPADFCPVSVPSSEESEKIYYIGHCSKMGSGEYGTQIKYPAEEEVDINGTKYIRSFYYYNKSADLVDFTGETYSNNSFCYQSTLVKNGIEYNATVARAICYESFCSDRSLTIKIKDDYFVCPRAGGKIEVEGYSGYFLCADYNLICSGTVMCNELFDCVDKKSETKEETYYYDYTILTSQNLEDAEIKTADNTNNYELSDNGVCPKDCKQCQKNNKCTKCRNNYNFVGSTNNSEEIKCLSESELTTGYYVLNNIYYKCMDNCDSCKDGKTCDKCSSGFDFINEQCIKIIENCDTYTKEGSCEKCKDNFAFKEDNRTQCLSKSSLDNYYTKDNGISYYPCDKEIQSCSKCYYNETQSKAKCYLCLTNFFLFESESCLSESNLNSTLYKMNSTHINKCSNAINNCNECTSDKSCTKCSNNYYMINDNKTNCIQSSSIPTDQYYLSKDQTMYYACNNSAYNDISNCKSCSDKTSCSLCQDEYTFIDGDKSKCVEITSLSNKYILDPQDKTNYIKCISLYSNCDTCNNLKCLTCNDDYTIFNDNCVSKSSLSTSKPIQTDAPSTKPTDAPITKPTDKPTEAPTNKPTDIPTTKPTETVVPTNKPTDVPTNKPTDIPSNKPTDALTNKPTDVPTNKLTDIPTNKPTDAPMIKPTDIPTNKPTDIPTNNQTDVSTNKPTDVPTNKPTDVPTNKPTQVPTNDHTNSPINPPTNVQTNIAINVPTNAPQILPTNAPTNPSIDEISKGIAEQKANITLSFEKINNFNYAQDKKTINFDLSILTQTGEINKGDEIITYVNLIYTNGTRQSSNTEAICSAQDIIEGTSSVRAKFSCTIEDLEGDYYSLRYNYSTNISGTPNDEISLDPVMTTKYKSSSEEKIIPTFTPISINHSSCQSTGLFTISGNLTEKLSQLNKFIIPLTYPEGITLSCELNQDQNLIECKADREIINQMIIIEQTVIKQGTEDYFNLKSIKSQDELICSNGALKDSIKKENSTISFRQVSHFENSNNELSFHLISLVSEKLDKGKNITINVNINNENEEKPINCILEDSINPQQGQTQGNFLCSVNKNENELWKNVNYQNISVSVSPNNDIISGVDSLDKTSSNPSKTDDEIEKIKEKKQNNETVNSLTEVIDYYSESVEVNTLTLNNINMDSCNTTGQLTLTGLFLDDIEEDINFDLPLTYPNTELKCELKEVEKNTETSIKCKVQTEFKSVENIVIEPRLIKKKNQELFYIQGKTFNFTEKKSCGKYETIKKQIIQNRQNSGIYYGFMGNLVMVNQMIQFFMALTRKSTDYTFENIYNFTTDITLSTRRNLRILDETTLSDVEVSCKLNQSLTLDLTGGYNCNSGSVSTQGTPISLQLDTDKVDGISGIEKANLQSLSNIDYSNKTNLETINSLPEITITNINGDSCYENGQYIISGTVSDTSNLESAYSNIEIKFSSPESTGLCEIEINKNSKAINMTCENSEKFDISQIIIDRSLIQDSEGNYIFIINSYSTADQFACDISLNSVKLNTTNIENIDTTASSTSTYTITPDSSYVVPTTDSGNRIRYRKSSSGLSKGAIAGIVIAAVVVVAIVVATIICIKKRSGSFNKNDNVHEDPTTVNNILYKPN